MTPVPVPAFAALRAYKPPKHPAPIDLDLAGNEGAAPPADLAAALDVETLRRYPSAAGVEAAFAARFGVAPEQALVTAGGDEAIDRVCRAFLAADRELILPTPTFVMIPHYAALAGAAVREVAWEEGPYPLEAVLAAITPRTGVIVVVSPNNPTGAVATADDLRRLAAAAPDALLLVDQAYAEFADVDLTRPALELPNAVVVRTLSKAWGLAGLRVGCALGAADTIATLRAAGGPYSVAGPSLAIAARALERAGGAAEAYVARVREERAALTGLALELGVEAPRSQGNFVLLRVRVAEWLRDACAGLGIGVRLFAGDPQLAGRIRIACPGDAAAFARLERALRAALAPRALLTVGELPGADALAARFADGARAIALAQVGDPATAFGPAWVVSRDPAAFAPARAAGRVPLALAEDADDAARDALLAAGAARVVSDLSAIETLTAEVTP